MSENLKLPNRLDTASADMVARMFGDCRGKPIEVDASEVETIGALGVQVLISARKTWGADSKEFAIGSASDRLLAACDLLGVPHQEIGVKTEQGS